MTTEKLENATKESDGNQVTIPIPDEENRDITTENGWCEVSSDEDSDDEGISTRLKDCGATTGIVGCGVGCGGLLTVGLFAASGAAVGATGSAVLKAAGHAGYNVLDATRGTTIGSSILGIPLAVLNIVLRCCRDSESQSDSQNRSYSVGSIVYGAAVQAAAGALGIAILNNATEMTAGQGAASAAVGSAILGGAAAGLAYCCNMACHS